MTNINLDGWGNIITGLGMKNRDKRMSTRFTSDATLTENELTNLYRGDGFGRRIIDLPANEMTREWIEIEGDTDGVMLEELDRIKAKNVVRDMIRWARLYGGALCVMGLDDGRDLAEPRYEPGLRRIAFLQVFDRFRITWTTADLYTDPTHPRYNLPEVYTINPTSGTSFRVHESRTLRLDGQPVPERIRLLNQGWGDSVFQSAYTQLRALLSVYSGVELIVDDFVQLVVSIKGLGTKLAADMEKDILERVNIMDMSRHIANTILLDADGETYQKHTSTVTGLPDVIDRFARALSAVTGFPITLLMGQSPAGLNATGDNDVRNWYDKISSEQAETLGPILTRLVELSFLAKDGAFRGKQPADVGAVVFRSLWQLTDKETAELRKQVADTDAIYINTGVLEPAEVALSRFGGETYSMETVIDPDADRTVKPAVEEPKKEEEKTNA